MINLNKRSFLFKIIYFISGFFSSFLIIKIEKNSNASNKKTLNEKEVLTLNLSEIPQIPWDNFEASIHVLETFNFAVHGKLFFNSNLDNEIIIFKKIHYINNFINISLNENIYFHNNRNVNAYDIEFSLYRYLLNNKNDSTLSILQNIVGVENRSYQNIKYILIDHIYYPSNYILGIKVIDKYNLIFEFKHNNLNFLEQISDSKLPIVPIEELKENYIEWKKFPVGFGKYKMIDADFKNHEFTLEKVQYEKYKPKYIKFLFSSNHNSDINILFSKTNNMNNINYKQIIFKDIYANAGFLYNYQTELGQNENFRKAISLALDRNKIASKALFNEIIPEDQMFHAQEPFKKYRSEIPIQLKNIQKAKDLLALVPSHLWQNKIFEVPTFCDTKDINSLSYMQEIKKQLAEIGIHINFLETNIKYDKFKKNDKNILWFTGFSFSHRNPLKNFAYFKRGSYFSYEYPKDPQYELLYQKSYHDIHNSIENIKKLSQYFTEKNLMTIIYNHCITASINTKKIAYIGKQKNGIQFQVSEIKFHI